MVCAWYVHVLTPRQLFTELTGLDDVLLLTDGDDGSPHGRRTMVLWNPPLRSTPTPLPPGKGVPLPGKGKGVLPSLEGSPGVGVGANAVGAGAGVASGEAGAVESESGGAGPAGGNGGGGSAALLRPRESTVAEEGRRESSNIEAAVLLAELVRDGLKTICFCSVRESGEMGAHPTPMTLTPQSPPPPPSPSPTINIHPPRPLLRRCVRFASSLSRTHGSTYARSAWRLSPSRWPQPLP